MAKFHSTAPRDVMQNLARARSYLKRDDLIRALETFISALEAYKPSHLLLKPRIEVEGQIMECIGELNRKAHLISFVEKLSKSKNSKVGYTPGNEAQLAAILPILLKALRDEDNVSQSRAGQDRDKRRKHYWEKACSLLESGDAPLGKSFLRKLADEFADEYGLFTQIGSKLLEYKLYPEAVEFLLRAIEANPKDSDAYRDLMASYQAMNELEKAEELYQEHMRQFGVHPRTLVNLANLYLRMGKREMAYDRALQAIQREPGNAEAQAIMDRIDRR